MGLVLVTIPEELEKSYAGDVADAVDVVDITDPDLRRTEAMQVFYSDRTPVVGDRNMCVNVSAIQVFAEHLGMRKLRFHGHGGPGFQGVACGHLTTTLSGLSDLARRTPGAISVESLEGDSVHARQLRRLRGCFEPGGWIELHGCNAGRGERGRKLVDRLAQIVGVRVYAGTLTQYAGGHQSFRFEGPVICGLPR